MRCSRVLSPAEDVPDDDFAQIDHDFPQPSVLVEQFIHARVGWRRLFGCREAALVRDESRFWSLVCHRPPSFEAAATIEPPARKCWRSMQRISSSNGEILAENSAESLSAP